MILECKKCPMNNGCICHASSDECVIRKESYNMALSDFVNGISESVLYGILAKVMKGDIGASDGADKVIDYLQEIAELIKRG